MRSTISAFVLVCLYSVPAVAQQGLLQVKLTPQSNGPYAPGEVVTVDVRFINLSDVNLEITFIRLDFTDSDPALGLPDKINFTIPVAGVEQPNLLIPTWQSPPNGPYFVIPPFGEATVGFLEVMVPDDEGSYLLDALNSDSTIPGTGAMVQFFSGQFFITWTALNGQMFDGQLTLNVACEPETEICNFVDDDCDGLIDEGFGYPAVDPNGMQFLLPPGSFCLVGEGICESQGTVICVDETTADCVSTAPIPPQQEGPVGHDSCFDWKDNDCDGLTDHEDPDCTGPEVCDGFDNDNDGQIDEGFFGLGAECTLGIGVCANTGEIICREDGTGVVCNAMPYNGLPEGPPGLYRCSDGLDNDCDGLIDLDDPDCQEPEICDGKDNDGDGEVDEDFPTLGDDCSVGQGQCYNEGQIICGPGGLGVQCSASPGAADPEGPAGCDCADGIDNDCDGLIDLDDPDCGSYDLRVECALPTTCGPVGDDCRSWHVIDFNTINGQPPIGVTAELLVLDEDNELIGQLPVEDGDLVRMVSRVDAADFVVETVETTIDLSLYSKLPDCLTGPGGAIADHSCRIFDSDCDDDVDARDVASLHNLIDVTLVYHTVAGPVPLLRVIAGDGHNRAQAFCSNTPFLGVIEPEHTVVIESEGNTTPVLALMPVVDPASIDVLVDGFDIIAGLGLDPATDFPGGPYGGVVEINGCNVTVCDLVVDTASIDEAASNSLSMNLTGLCCGGHVIVVTGDPVAGVYPDDAGDDCFDDDIRDKGFSQTFQVDVLFPTEGVEILGDTFPATVQVCHGQELHCPLPTICNPFVWINGLGLELGSELLIPGDDETSADTWLYTGTWTLSRTDLHADIVGGIHQPGTFDPGINLFVAQARDDSLNTAYDNLYIGMGPLQPVPGPNAGDAAVDNAVTLAITDEAMEDLMQGMLQQAVPGLVGGEVEKWINAFYGESFELGQLCSPGISIYPDIDSLDIDFNGFTYSMSRVLGLITVTVDAPDITVEADAGGYCKASLCGFLGCICLYELSIDMRVKLTVSGASLVFTATEDDILAGDGFVVSFDPGTFTTEVVDNDSDANCIVGFILDVFEFLSGIDNAIAFVIDLYIENFLDISQWVGNIQLDPITFDPFELSDASFPKFMMDLVFVKNEVQITPSGVAVGYNATFVPSMVDANVQGAMATPLTAAPLAQPNIVGADPLTIALSDDALNQLFYSLTITGKFQTSFEEQNVLGTYLPADCDTVMGDEQAQCVALKGGNCLALDFPEPATTCIALALVADQINIDDSTLLIMNGNMNVPPKILLLDDPLTDQQFEAVVRLSQLNVTIVADRDESGETDGSAPGCLAAIPSTIDDCTLWQACMDINVPVILSLAVQDGVPVLDMVVDEAQLSTGTFCGGGTAGPFGDALDDIALGETLDIIEDLIDSQVPPIAFDGLELGGLITFENPRLIGIENDGDADFQDYLGITGDLAISD